LLIGLTFCLASEANAACIDLKQANNLSFEGILNYRIFAGPPNYEDVRKGDAPEPTYILTLPEPICASGDEFVDPSDKFNEVQIFPESSDKAAQALSRDLRRLVGKRVVVEGTSPFGAHTGHPADAAHNQNLGCFRPHGILRHCHDDRASVLRGTGRGQR
jgi:hypothetical protein